jgi:virulence factor Mce-like protein
MRRGRTQSLAANPVLIGAATVLVIVVAVFLAYNANNGLPFVPTTELKALVPNAAKLVAGNEVREGGFRIGVVSDIRPVVRRDGKTVAELTMQLDKKASPVPSDSTLVIRSRSALGLKYVEFHRGAARRELPNGATLVVGSSANPVDLEDFLGTFDAPTRDAIQANLYEYGNAFAGRGVAINRTLASLPAFLRNLAPVMNNLADPRTQLARFIQASERIAAATAPVSDSLVAGFRSGADTFEALSRDPRALRDTIAKGPATLDAGIRSFGVQRPFLRHLAALSTDLRGTARELRRSLPAVNRALVVGTPVLKRTPALNARLGDSFAALRDLASAPPTNVALRGLTDTVGTLNPMLRYLGPFVTVCNYWNYWWTNLSDHLSDQDSTGQIERIEAKSAGNQTDAMNSFGATHPAHGQNYAGPSFLGDPAYLHNQPYGSAVTPSGQADCETGQRGYPTKLSTGSPYDIVVDPHTPGAQGPTYTGSPAVPAGETFSARPENGVTP